MSNSALHALLQPMAITERWLRVLADHAIDPQGKTKAGSDIVETLSNRGEEQERGGVCIVPVKGPLSKEPSVWSWLFGGTSYVGLRHEIEEAVETGLPIILAFDSPGGEVFGCGETADYIHRLRESGVRIEAYIEGQGDSAAYWLASQCDRITINASGEAGSIGVRCLVVDDSKFEEAVGIKSYDIVADQSPLKVVDPSKAADRQRVKDQMTAFAGVFVAAVARGRNTTLDRVLNEFGRGDVMIGQAAVSAGLADRVGTLDSLIAELSANSMENQMKVNGTAASAPAPAASVSSGKCSSCRADMDDGDPMYCKSCYKDDADASAFAQSVCALLGAKDERAAIGAITGLKVQAEKATALQAELEQARKEKADAEVKGILDAACSDGRIPPAARGEFEGVYAAGGLVALNAALKYLKPAVAPATPPTEAKAKEAADAAVAAAPNAKPAPTGFSPDHLKVFAALGVDPAKAAAHKTKLAAIINGQSEDK